MGYHHLEAAWQAVRKEESKGISEGEKAGRRKGGRKEEGTGRKKETGRKEGRKSIRVT